MDTSNVLVFVPWPRTLQDPATTDIDAGIQQQTSHIDSEQEDIVADDSDEGTTFSFGGYFVEPS